MLACPKCQLKKKIETRKQTKKQRVQKAMTGGKIGVKVRVDVFNARKVKISAYDAMVNPGKV